MNASQFPTLLALCATSLLSQAPASAPHDQGHSDQAQADQIHASDLGFTYSLPADWEVMDMAPVLPVVQQQASKSATSEDEKKGVACAQLALTARHGDPPSVIVVVTLPFDCFGQQMTEKDLAGVGEGASEGIKKSLDVSGPTYGAYTLGTHSVWIERATGSFIGHPDIKRTVETVCGILKKGAVCWMTLAVDDAALKIFEHGAVALDGDAPAALVPATAFNKKPL